jgi:hypothetical protein
VGLLGVAWVVNDLYLGCEERVCYCDIDISGEERYQFPLHVHADIHIA